MNKSIAAILFGIFVAVGMAAIPAAHADPHDVVATIPVEVRPLAVVISPDGSKAYVSNFALTPPSSISVIDTKTNTVVDTIPVGLAVPDNTLSHRTARPCTSSTPLWLTYR